VLTKCGYNAPIWSFHKSFESLRISQSWYHIWLLLVHFSLLLELGDQTLYVSKWFKLSASSAALSAILEIVFLWYCLKSEVPCFINCFWKSFSLVSVSLFRILVLLSPLEVFYFQIVELSFKGFFPLTHLSILNAKLIKFPGELHEFFLKASNTFIVSTFKTLYFEL